MNLCAAFSFAYGAKAVTAVLMASRKWSSLEGGYAEAIHLLHRPDTVRFGLFFGSLVGVFRLTEIASRVARGRKDRINLAIAGGVSGLTLLVDSPKRREVIALYVFVRMLDVVGRYLTAEQVLPQWEYSSEALFAASNSFIMYAFLCEPALLPKSYYKWILHMGNVTHEGLDQILRQGLQNGEFHVCQPQYHV